MFHREKNQARSHTGLLENLWKGQKEEEISVQRFLPIILLRGKGFSCLFHLELAMDSAKKFCFSDATDFMFFCCLLSISREYIHFMGLYE